MFEKEAEDSWQSKDLWYKINADESAYKTGFQDGYNKANEWHRVSDKLPEMDVLVYLWKEDKDFPLVARRHVSCVLKEWVWDCKWGSGFTISQLNGKDYWWKEIVLPALPKEIKENE